MSALSIDLGKFIDDEKEMSIDLGKFLDEEKEFMDEEKELINLENSMDEKEEKQMYNERFAYEDVFTLASDREAVQYLGEEGYFADDYETLASRVELGWSHTLDAVYPKQVKCFNSSESSGPNSIGGVNYGLFLPKDRVREPELEPTYRPFTVKEFKDQFKVGEVVTYRNINHRQVIITSLVNSIECEAEVKISVLLGYREYDPQYLFENFELLDNGEWVPFGVQEY